MRSNKQREQKSWPRSPFLRPSKKMVCIFGFVAVLCVVLYLILAEINEMLKEDLINEDMAVQEQQTRKQPYPQHLVETIVIIPQTQYLLQSAWEEDGEIYGLLVKPEGRPKDYLIRKIDDGRISNEVTKYSRPMKQCIKYALAKSPGRDYTYEASYGHDGKLYLVGRDAEDYIKRLYVITEDGYSNIPLLADVKDNDLLSFAVSKKGTIYVSDDSGMYVYWPNTRSLDAFNGASSTREYNNIALGSSKLYQILRSKIYIWDTDYEIYKFDNWLQSDLVSSAENVAYADAQDNLYLANHRGISYLPYGSTLWEILVDDSYTGFDTAVYELRQLWVKDNECYLVNVNKQSGEQNIICYTLK